MQPDSQQPGQQFEANYLDSIAAPTQVKKVSPFLLWGLIGGLLLVIIFVVMAISSNTGTPAASLASVGATYSNLQEVSEAAQKNIQSGKLRSLNSNLTLTLTNTNRDLAIALKAQKINIKETKKNKSLALVKKDFTNLAQRLEDARLNAVYDRTYAREITFAIKTLRSDMTQLYKSTKMKDLKTTLETGDKDLSLLLEGFQTFNDS